MIAYSLFAITGVLVLVLGSKQPFKKCNFQSGERLKTAEGVLTCSLVGVLTIFLRNNQRP
jgi:hypothetical protein